MRKSKISETIGHINTKHIEEAAAYVCSSAPYKKNIWIKIGAIAACLALVLVGISFLVPKLSPTKQKHNYPHPLNRSYISYTTSELGIVWPWEYKAPIEKFTSVVYAGSTFRTCGSTIDEVLLKDPIGSCIATGYELDSDTEHTASLEVYSITGVPTDRLIAVYIDDEFCVFALDSYNPPATLGELIEAYNLTQTLELSYYSMMDSNNTNGHYRIDNDDYIWNILSNCEAAPFVEDDSWTAATRKYISFTITSETLGIYKHALYITEDGYVWTNAFQWAYIYHIGKDAAKQIIDYATAHGTEASYEPYLYSIAGTIVDIDEDYIYVDDSILCREPDDGMIFKIPADSLLVRRYVEYMGIKVGDIVQVEFKECIDTKHDYVIKGFVSMSEAYLHGDDIAVPE